MIGSDKKKYIFNACSSFKNGDGGSKSYKNGFWESIKFPVSQLNTTSQEHRVGFVPIFTCLIVSAKLEPGMSGASFQL